MSYQLQICINIYQGYKGISVQTTTQFMKGTRNILSLIKAILASKTQNVWFGC